MGKISHENNYDVIHIIMSLRRRNGAVIIKIIFSLIICIPRTIVGECSNSLTIPLIAKLKGD